MAAGGATREPLLPRRCGWASADPALFRAGRPGAPPVPAAASRAAARAAACWWWPPEPRDSRALEEPRLDPLPEPQGESLPPPPFSLSFRLEEERRTRRRSLSLSESRRRRLLEAACCWGESGGGRDEGGREWWPEDGCCCCLPEGWWRWRWWWCSAGEVGKGTATEDEVSRAAEGGLEVSQTGTAVAEEDGEGGAGNGDRGAAADWVLSLCAGIEAAEEREVAAVALLLGAVANGDVVVSAAAAEVGAGAAEDDDDAGLHLTVTSPLGSDKNHSERCLIRSVCFWWTCKGAKRGTVSLRGGGEAAIRFQH